MIELGVGVRGIGGATNLGRWNLDPLPTQHTPTPPPPPPPLDFPSFAVSGRAVAFLGALGDYPELGPGSVLTRLMFSQG